MRLPLSPAVVLAQRHRTGRLLVGALLGHLLLISLQVNTAAGTTVFHAVVFGAVGEVQTLVAAGVGLVASAWQRYVALWTVADENARLRARIGQLELDVQRQRAQALKAERLEALLGLQARVPLRTLAAEVIAGDATSWFRTVTINRGTADGLAADLAVVAPRGIVGRIIGRPAPHAARVQLLVDRNAAAAALVERSRTGGVVVGDDGVMLRMDFVSNLADVRAGDVVVTSGLDGIYPKGLVIGEVTAVERGPGLYLQVRVRPAVDFSAVEEVLVVLEPAGLPAGAEPPLP